MKSKTHGKFTSPEISDMCDRVKHMANRFSLKASDVVGIRIYPYGHKISVQLENDAYMHVRAPGSTSKVPVGERLTWEEPQSGIEISTIGDET
jgi:hypothetical protein